MMKRFSGNNEARPDELGSDPGQVGPDSAGQSGDTQGLSPEADAADESVEELADTDQPYEAGIAEGVEDAEDHPEQEKPDQRRRRGDRMAQLRGARGQIAEARARVKSGHIVMLRRPHQMSCGIEN